MVNENVDIASLLSLGAGQLLALASELHTKMSSREVQRKNYFELRAKERELCIQSVILFQASMEAMINEEIENEPKLSTIKRESDELNRKFKMMSFKNKWQNAFAVLKISKKENEFLEKYLHFYIKFRVPITHAKSRYVNAEDFNFLNVYEGMKNGYRAVEAFYRSLQKFSHEHSWKTFAEKSSLPV